jgi:hypothetical protein
MSLRPQLRLARKEGATTGGWVNELKDRYLGAT